MNERDRRLLRVLASALVAITVMGSSRALSAQAGPGGTLVVVNKQASTADLIDVGSGGTIATLPTGQGPHELVLSSDGRTAVVTDYSGGNSLTVIDVLERRVVRTVDLAAYARPHGIDFLPGDSLVAVTSEGTGNVVIVRVANGRVVQALATGQGGSHMLSIVGDGSRIYTSNMSGNTVSELDVEHGGRTRLFSVPPTPEAITVSSDGSEVWVGSNDHGTVSVVSTVDGSVETPLSGFGWPYRILLVPQRGLVVIPDLRANQVRIVERASRSELVRLEFPGGSPQGVTVTPDGRWLFLSLSGQDRVAMIDLLAREVVKYIATGSGPDGIGWSPLESGGADAAELAPSPVPVVEALAGDVALVGGRLFDGLGDALRANPGILVRNGVIVQVGYDPAEIGAESVRIVPLDDDQTVLPGLFDVHAHYAVDLFGEGRVDEYEVNPSVFLANGVTSTFPGGEVDPEGMLEARREIDAGLRPGPRIFNSGPYFGTARPGWRAELMSADSIRSEVDYWAARGASGFKAKGIAPQHLAPLIDQAHLHGLPVNGHLDSGMSDSVNPADAIAMGIDRIEHFLGGAALPAERSAYASLEALELSDPRTSSEMRDVARLYVEHGVFFDATLTAYGYFAPTMYERWFDEMALLTPYARHAVESRLPRIRSDQFARIDEVKLSTVKAFYDAGGGPWLTLGTDHPSWGEYFSGFGAHRELAAMVQAGIPPAAALRAATIYGARALGAADHLGTIEAGKYADLFVVDGDPLADIRTTREVVKVMKGGRIYEPGELLAAVMGRLGPASAAEASWWKGSERFGGER